MLCRNHVVAVAQKLGWVQSHFTRCSLNVSAIVSVVPRNPHLRFVQSFVSQVHGQCVVMGHPWSCPRRSVTRDDAKDPSNTPECKALGSNLGYGAMLWQFWVDQFPPTLANVLEWYEFSAYAFVEDCIAVAFNQSHAAAWTAFAVTFVSRPFGGLAFGLVADTFGRRSALLASVYLMFGATVGQGLAPTIAYLGPLWMLLCRLLQGLASAGEVGALAVMLAESAPPPILAQTGSLIMASGRLGFMSALSVSTVLHMALSRQQMMRWGWRVPFLLAAVPGLLVIRCVHEMHESPEFEQAHTFSEETPKATVLDHWRTGLLAVAGSIGGCSVAYVWGVWLQQWLVGLGTSRVQALWVVLAGTTVSFVAQFLTPLLGDMYGVARSGIGLSLFGVIAAVPSTAWLYHSPQSSLAVGVAGIAVPGLMQGATALMYPWCCELFPLEVRGAAVSLYFNLGAMAGGLSPLICHQFNYVPLFPGYYVALVSGVSLVAVGLSLVLHEAHKEDATRLQVVHIRPHLF